MNGKRDSVSLFGNQLMSSFIGVVLFITYNMGRAYYLF